MTLVRYYGHPGQVTGYGIAAERMCASLIAAGYELEVRPLSPPDTHPWRTDSGWRGTVIRRDDELTVAPDITIVHTLPIDCRNVLKALTGRSLVDVLNSHLVAYTTLDYSNPMPAEMGNDMAGDFDQHWFPCQMNALQADAHLPNCKVMPHALDAAGVTYPREPLAYTDKDPYSFYYVGAWSERKNPKLVVDAYLAEFTAANERVELVIKSTPEANAYIQTIESYHPRPYGPSAVIGVIDYPLSGDSLWNLHRTAHCYVSPTRMEAWNLPVFDAMLAGNHIITTHGVGSDDYLSGMQTSATLIGGTEVPMKIGGRTSPWAKWWDVDIGALRTAMRAAYETRPRLTVNYDIASRYSYEAVGQLARSYLENL